VLEKMTAINSHAPVANDDCPSREIALARWASNASPSAVQTMLKVASSPEVISFALGLPASELFPAADYCQAVKQVLLNDRHSLQYGPPPERLKAQVAELMKARGVSCDSAEVFLTAGAQQGMSLLAHLTLNPGASVLVDELTYPGFRQAIEPFEPQVLTVSTDLSTGIRTDEVEHLLKQGVRPAFIYVIPNGHNPLAVTMDLAARHHLADLARKFSVPIIEDDAYGFLYYDTDQLPCLKELAPEWVCYLGSFSKIMAPALRIGWVLAPPKLAAKLAIVKEAADINTGTLAQRALAVYLDRGVFSEHLTNLRGEYQKRRDAMFNAVMRHFPAGTRCAKPISGMFLWVRLSCPIDTGELLRVSLKTARVAFLPGDAFCGRKSGNQGCMRLNFSNCTIQQIEDGVDRLASVLRQALLMNLQGNYSG